MAYENYIIGKIATFNDKGEIYKTFNGVIRDFKATEYGVFLQIEN